MLLLIDNYDSFTYNLAQYFGELGEKLQVVRNDAITVEEAEALKPARLHLAGTGESDAGRCLERPPQALLQADPHSGCLPRPPMSRARLWRRGHRRPAPHAREDV